MRFSVTVLPGDGVGPEIIAEAVKVLKTVGGKYDHEFSLEYALMGGVAIDKTGSALPEETLELCRKSDAVLFGAVGDPKWDKNPQAKVRPEDGLLALRKGLGLFANLRPVKVYPALVDATNLKPEVIDGVDFVFVRELTGGLYFGQPKKRWETAEGRQAVDTMAYSDIEIDRIMRVGFELARRRKRKLTSVDKANVLETSRLWRQVAMEVAGEYSDVAIEHIFADACAMNLVLSPDKLDVLVSENTFGDILTDEASVLAGSLGMLPSASLAGIPKEGDKTFGLYEPVHCSAPSLTGQDKVNPVATILSAAMMLRYSFGLEKEAGAVETAVDQVLEAGFRTDDIMSDGKTRVGTGKMGDMISERIV